MKKKEHGFTLIELLVVIAIIGILAAVILASVNSARAKARDAARLSDLKQITNALVMAADKNNGIFPGSSGMKCLGATTTCWGGVIAADTTLNTVIQEFLTPIPSDPSPTRARGDKYVYGDANTSVAFHCSGTVTPDNPYGVAYPRGPYLLWMPESGTPSTDTQCKGKGFMACCGSVSCAAGNYCAYKIQ